MKISSLFIKSSILFILVVFTLGCENGNVKIKDKINDLENDKLKGKVKSVIINHSGAFTKQETHTYNIDGYKISEESIFKGEYQDENGSHCEGEACFSYGLIVEKTEFLRDAQNNVIEETQFSKTPIKDFEIIEKDNFGYDENGNIISKTENYKNQNSSYSFNYKNKYDKNTNLIECLNVLDNSKEKFKYDDKNNIVEHINSNGKTKIKYDQNNNKVFESGPEINSGGRRELKYDKKNNLIKEINYSFENKISSIIIHIYKNQRLTEDKFYNEAGVLYRNTLYDKFDSFGNWTESTTSDDDGMIYITKRIIEYYSANEKTSSEISEVPVEYINYLKEYQLSALEDNSRDIQFKRIGSDIYWITNYHDAGSKQEMYWKNRDNLLIPEFIFEYGGENWNEQLHFTFISLQNNDTLVGKAYENEILTRKNDFVKSKKAK